MLKSALYYKVTAPLGNELLNEKLRAMRFAGIGRVEVQSIGFEPLADGYDLITQSAGIQAGCVRIDKKTIPSSALKELLKERCKKIEAQQGYAPGRKQTKEIKEQLVDELLPNVLPKTARITFLIYDAMMIIGTSSSAAADTVLGMIGKCLDPFPLEVFHTEQSPAAAMTQWLVQDEAPANFSLDQEAEMKTNSETKASVRWKNESVDAHEADEHFKQGKQVIKLAMTWADKISFVLNDRGVLSKIKPVDLLVEQEKAAAEQSGDDLESNIALFGGELKRLIDELIDAQGGEAR